MCFWLSKRVHTIILDCHGAHEAFTVASVLAAQKLVVVTTTDPGSFDGTVELLDAVNSRTKLGMGTPEDTVLVFNNCPPDAGQQLEEKIKEEMKRLESQKFIKSRGTVCIPDDPQIREMIKSYEFGHISQHRELWEKIGEITKLLRHDSEKESFARPSQPIAPDVPDAEQMILSTTPLKNEE